MSLIPRKKRIKAIISAFGSDGLDLENSYYYHMPGSLSNTIETMIKKEFEKYKGATKYKTECFNIEDLRDVMQRIEELTEPFGNGVAKKKFIQKVTLIEDEYSEKPVVRSTKYLYSVYKLIMNNKETFDDLFLERLEEDRSNADEVKEY